MDREKLSERFLRIYFESGESLLVDVNLNSDLWQKILSQKEKIVKVESHEWLWYLSTNEIIFH